MSQIENEYGNKMEELPLDLGHLYDWVYNTLWLSLKLIFVKDLIVILFVELILII